MSIKVCVNQNIISAILIFFLLVFVFRTSQSQKLIPEGVIDSITSKAIINLKNNYNNNINDIKPIEPPENGVSQIFRFKEKINKLDFNSLKKQNIKNSDTLFVGLTPNDSIYISGLFYNDGPIFIFGDGVLVFDNVQALINGDIIIWGDEAKLIIKDSKITMPQAYIYQRSIIAAGKSHIVISNTTMDYSGLSHNLVLIDSAKVDLLNVKNIGFTTCGLWSNSEIFIDGSNQAGEFIMDWNANASFNNANTILIWHHISDTSELNIEFPEGDTLDAFQFDENTPGVVKIHYSYTINNCTDVMWGIMPEKGSYVSINNSELRTIGIWFKNQSDILVSGLVNNSYYANFTAPLNGYNIVLQNTKLRTWSLYFFENALGSVSNCILGEVGLFSNSNITVDNVLIDGSGGYVFTENSSFNINGYTYFNCDFQTKDTSFAFLVYGGQNWGHSLAIDNSIMFVIQSNLTDVPEVYNDAMIWYLKLEGSSTLFADADNSIIGSAWIDKASNFYINDFAFYTLEYKHVDSADWKLICGPVYNKAYSEELYLWNTSGIKPGAYILKLNMFDNTLDSNKAEAVRLYNIVNFNNVKETNNSSFDFLVFPNPVKDKIQIVTDLQCFKNEIYNIAGRLMLLTYENKIDVNVLPSGIYILRSYCENGKIFYNKIIVK